MPKITPCSSVPTYQAPASYSAVAVQNVWNTVLDTTVNCRIIQIASIIATAGETIQMELTVDGQTITSSVAQNNDAVYFFLFEWDGSGGASTTTDNRGRSFLIEGKSVKVRIRKTTANGANALSCSVMYAKY